VDQRLGVEGGIEAHHQIVEIIAGKTDGRAFINGRDNQIAKGPSQ
jgi:hypothetical protein